MEQQIYPGKIIEIHFHLTKGTLGLLQFLEKKRGDPYKNFFLRKVPLSLVNRGDHHILFFILILRCLDEALRRRFEKRIHIPLPDLKGRFCLFDLFLKDIQKSKNIDFMELARLTDGYSGKLFCFFFFLHINKPNLGTIKSINQPTHQKKY